MVRDNNLFCLVFSGVQTYFLWSTLEVQKRSNIQNRQIEACAATLAEVDGFIGMITQSHAWSNQEEFNNFFNKIANEKERLIINNRRRIFVMDYEYRDSFLLINREIEEFWGFLLENNYWNLDEINKHQSFLKTRGFNFIKFNIDRKKLDESIKTIDKICSSLASGIM